MTDWQTYRNGNPRQPWDLERLAGATSRRATSQARGAVLVSAYVPRCTFCPLLVDAGVSWWVHSGRT
jgi:hypothetical protein